MKAVQGGDDFQLQWPVDSEAPQIIRMGWGYDSDFVFDANRTQYWRRIYRVQFVINFSIFDWIVGIFWSAPRYIVSSAILCHGRLDWHATLVLMVMTSSRDKFDGVI